MRSYLSIINDLQDGEKPEYEELRFTCLMAENLRTEAEMDIMKLIGNPVFTMKEKVVLTCYENRFYAREKSPIEWLTINYPDMIRRDILWETVYLSLYGECLD